MSFKELQFETQGHIAVVTMMNPEQLNAFSIQMGKELINVFYECERKEGILSIVLTGYGRAFCAGGHIKHMADCPEDRKCEFLKNITGELNDVVTTIRRIPKPVIAAVNGVAAGAGFSLALACDLIVASENARFSLAHFNMGLHPDGGAIYFLERVVGIHKTRELVFRRSVIDANTAARLNIVNQVVSPTELNEKAMTLAQELSNGPAIAIGLAKRVIDQGLIESLDGHLENERQAIAQTGRTRDHIEGITAFLEKRKPQFKGC
jgi:2-(1,2-epoxy-1,2-dihydrophenyl)acetyl-CoA isomerase